ncbi:MAG: BamA/TamA family outer membrane protein [Prevotella sp.]|nr:BamA/TamA family outer membrane protein [Prevotella sp.]
MKKLIQNRRIHIVGKGRIEWYFCFFMLFSYCLFILVSCSTTSGIPNGEQLYTGLKTTKYQNYEKTEHFYTTKEETDIVLATEPNAALFGSSSHRSPFPIGLWIWNAFSTDSIGFGHWMTKVFGSKPVLMSSVRPELHASVGENTLRKRGYFNGKISFELLPQHNPKKSKLQYTVDMGHLWTLDSIRYVNFPIDADSIIRANMGEAYIQRGDPFDVATLESERQRITNLFRDNGYFFYEKAHASFLADSVSVPGKVQLRLQMADELDDSITRKWYIGDMTVNFRKDFMEKLDSTRHFRTFTVNYNGRRPPIRTRVILNDLQLRPHQLYSRQKHEASQKKINSSGLFSRTSFEFVPRDSSNILDLTLDCIFDKPYDFYVEAYGKGKTSGKFGPEVIIGLTKRNAFRGGEQLNVNMHGSYEWQMGHRGEGSKTGINSYSYGAEASLTFPRIVNPFQKPMRKRIEQMRMARTDTANVLQSSADVRRRSFRRRFYDTPTTTLKASSDIVNRADYFKRHAVSGELRYNWQTSAQSAFEFSPLTLTYEYMTSRTDSFIHLQELHPYLKTSMADQFIPKISFSYSYRSLETLRNPIYWWTTVSEASNLLSAGYAIFGEKWSEKNKTMFKNPYAQFVKLETNFTKTWRLTDKSSLAAHVNGGVIWTYGNSNVAPYTEQFYAGGANSIRAFNVRSIGPGKYRPVDRRSSYVEQTGDIKLVGNLEYRPRLFGNLYGALFLDAGNVWAMHDDDARIGAKFEMKNFFRQIAVGTGIGLRYDLDFFILRVDWGIGLHVPYETTKSGFYNIDHFFDAQTLHLAIGLPF